MDVLSTSRKVNRMDRRMSRCLMRPLGKLRRIYVLVRNRKNLINIVSVRTNGPLTTIKREKWRKLSLISLVTYLLIVRRKKV